MKAAANQLSSSHLRWSAGICLTVALLFGCGPSADPSPSEGNRSNPSDAVQATAQLPEPAKSHDVVFGSNYSGNYEIYLMAQDGADVRQLTDDPACDNWWPRISPDRKKILYYRAPFGEDGRYEAADLMVMDSDGRNIRLLRAAGDDNWRIQAHAEWSPDGNELVMCGTSGDMVQLFITDDQGGDPRQITFDGTWNCDPSWSPDGGSIVFNRCEGDCGSQMVNLDIYTIQVSDGARQRLTADQVADYDPYYSPDGAAIAWLTNADPKAYDGIGAWSIRMMGANGADPRSVIDDHQINSKPAWSLNGDRIFFHRLSPSTDKSNRWRIFSIHPDGTHLTDIDPFDSGQSEYPSS